MRYTEYRYLYPPRPEAKIAPNILPELERQGWWAQAKFDGDCEAVYVPPDRMTSFAKGRHGPDNDGRWQPGKQWGRFARSLPGDGWYVFEGEALHKRGVGVVDTISLFDILVADGEYLIGKTYAERQTLLSRICKGFEPTPELEMTHDVIEVGIWRAQSHAHAFRQWFDAPAPAYVEGLVIKNPNARLLPCGKPTSNAAWQMKCRRATDHVSY